MMFGHDADYISNDAVGSRAPLSQDNEPSHAAAKAQVLVEQNRVHMDGTDTALVLAALTEYGVGAEATEQTTLLKAQWWVLTLHWIGDDLPHLGFDSLLTLLGQRVWKHYKERGKKGPARIDVYGADDEVVVSHEIDDGDEDFCGPGQ